MVGQLGSRVVDFFPFYVVLGNAWVDLLQRFLKNIILIIGRVVDNF